MIRKSRKILKQEDIDHPFYQQMLDEAEKIDFARVPHPSEVDDEIALFRVKIKSFMKTDDPGDVKLMLGATAMLVKLVNTRYTTNQQQKDGLKAAIENVLKTIGIPLTAAILSKKL